MKRFKDFKEHLDEAKAGETCSCCDNKIDENGKCGCGPDCEHCGGQHDMSEAARRKGAPKMTGDSIAIQRAKDAEHNKAMGRTKTGRKKPVRQMTSTQKWRAAMNEEVFAMDIDYNDEKSLARAAKSAGITAKFVQAGAATEMQLRGDKNKIIKFLKAQKFPASEISRGWFKEEVELDEAIDQKKFSAGAKAMKAYAQKNGGVDKKDFMEVSKLLDQIGRINILQAGQLLSRLNRLVDGMDTDVRERIFVELKKVGLVESVELDEILDTPKAMDSYKNKAKYSRDRASGSATAKILSKGTLGSHKPELDTMRKRHKGMDMADRNAARKTRKALMNKEEVELGEATYLKGKLEDRADAHDNQAQHHDEQAAKAHKAGDKGAASIHKAASRAHAKAANYIDKHLAKPAHLRGNVGSATSDAAHKQTQRANDVSKDAHWNESFELDEARGTSAKYAGKSGMFGGKYTSKDRMLDMKAFDKIRNKRAKQRDAEHAKQDPKMRKMGYAKHMLDTDKADDKARKRGIDPAGKYDKYKKRNGIREELDEATINAIAAEYINENNITLDELENMTEAELNELIGKAIGGAFKIGAKAAVGAARLAKRAVVNKQGNIRGTKAAKQDKAGDRAEKEAKKREAEYKRKKRIQDAEKRARDMDKKIADMKSDKP